MHHPTDRITHTTAFVTPVMEHWLEREIAQLVHPMKDRSDEPPHHERTLYLWATPAPMYIQVVTVNTQCTMNIHYIHCDFVEEIHWKVVWTKCSPPWLPLRDTSPLCFSVIWGKRKVRKILLFLVYESWMIRQSIKTMINIVTVIHSENQKVLYELQNIRISLFPSVTVNIMINIL